MWPDGRIEWAVDTGEGSAVGADRWGVQRIAAIVPCWNEAASIAKVVADLQRELPGADVYVYDNNSTDATADIARAAGAIVRTEARKGKGNVVRRAFADIDADVYVMVDGDDTYSAESVPAMVDALFDGPYDHVLGVREESAGAAAYRPGHALGNRLFNWLVRGLFGEPVSDMLSGCRVFSRRFVKSFPALSREFEIETELTVHYSVLRLPHQELPVGFRERPEGSESKLRTFRDGFKILRLLGSLARHERPVATYGLVGAVLILAALVAGVPVIAEFLATGLVLRFPTAILASSLVVLGVLTAFIGIILDGVRRARRETARLAYLSFQAPSRAF